MMVGANMHLPNWPENDLERQIIALIGEDEAFILFENHGGTRVFFPCRDWENSVAFEGLSKEAAYTLSKEFGRDYVRIPLARKFRCLRYCQDGLSERQAAKRLGMTEAGIGRIKRYLRDQGLLSEPKDRLSA